MRRPAGPNLPRPRRTERAASARPAEPLCKAAKPPSYLSYSSYWSYRGIREEVHLASNQYGPGKMANFPCSAKTPVRAKPDGPTPVALRANRSLTAPAAHRLRALSFSREHHPLPERALLHFPYLLNLLLRCPLARRRRAGGAGRTSPCRGVGQRPTPFQFSFPFLFLINRRAPARPKSASICEICVSHSGVLPAAAGP